MAGSCPNHDALIEVVSEKADRSEMWKVISVFILIVGALLGCVWTNSASVKEVNAVDEKVEYRDASMEKRSLRIEQSLDKLIIKMDAIDAYLRGGTTGARYQ
jgi:hypothetical protein